LIYKNKNRHNKQNINIMVKFSAYFLTYRREVPKNSLLFDLYTEFSIAPFAMMSRGL